MAALSPAARQVASEQTENKEALAFTEFPLQNLERLASGREALPENRVIVPPEVLQDKLLTVCQIGVQRCGGLGASGELLPVGIHQLGVVTVLDEGEGLDLVFVAPDNMQLSVLHQELGRLLASDPDAKVFGEPAPDGQLEAPGLEFRLQGTRVRLLLAQRISDIPLPSSVAIVQSTSALIGWQVSQLILEVVPAPDQFRKLLRCIRRWAKLRGVYGERQEYGMIGGTGWAICCARICQTSALDASLPQLVHAFFRQLSEWDWRKKPVALVNDPSGPSEELSRTESGSQTRMLVKLPYGHNLAAAVCQADSTLKVLEKELRRGCRICHIAQQGMTKWAELIRQSDFFERYRNFLEFDFVASSEEILHKFLTYGRKQLQGSFMETGAQGVVEMLEAIHQKCRLSVRPWPAWIHYKDADWPHCRALFIGVRVCQKVTDGSKPGQAGQQKVVLDLREVIVSILEKMSAWPEADRYEGKFDHHIRHVRQQQVKTWVATVAQGKVVQHDSGFQNTCEVSGEGAGASSGYPQGELEYQ